MQCFFRNKNLFTAEYFEEFKAPCEKWTRAEDKLIWTINQERMCPRFGDFEQMEKEWQKLFDLYETNVREVEQLRALEKGERYLSD